MYSPKNRAILELDQKFTDEIILEGGLKLYLDPSYRPEWNVTVTGTVKALPRDYQGELEVGQKVFFSYMVVNQRTFKSDEDYFLPTMEGSDFFKEFQDKRGRQITVLAFPEVITKRWAGSLYDETGWIDGCQGSESDVERWLSQFKFGTNEDQVYKNLLEIDGKDYWLCDLDLIFAHKPKKNLKALGSYVLLKPIDIDVTERIKIMKGIEIPESSIKMRREDCGRVVSVPNKKITLNEGDIGFFNMRFAEKYDFEGNQYFIVKQDRILSRSDN